VTRVDTCANLNYEAIVVFCGSGRGILFCFSFAHKTGGGGVYLERDTGDMYGNV
jgi:hypothetical protein